MNRKEEIEVRKAELRTEINEAESEEKVQELEKEVDALNEEVELIEETEKEKDIEEQVQEGEIVPEEVSIEEKSLGGIKMKEEKRNSKEYINAYAEYMKESLVDGYKMSQEARALITTEGYATGNSATVEVPDIVENVVRTAWEREELIQLVKKTFVPGNFKVQFEVSGDAASVHTEGNGAVSEESLVLGVVELAPQSIKKWISVSDEVLDMRGEDFLNYIYDEITYRIAKKCADELIGIIKQLPQSLSANNSGVYDKVSAAKVSGNIGLDTIINAVSQLSDEARDITIVMNKATYASFKAVQLAAGYAQDIFDGHRVVFNNSLPAYNAATAGQVYAIVGDFGEGSQLNFPNGDGITIKYDDKTAMEYDLVRILGREYVGMNAVADKAFTLLAKAAETSE
ncbi:MAG: phage major capsid protein [Bacilli bacterium]|nr:phage major capsid protein [Bacilli bacterium]